MGFPSFSSVTKVFKSVSKVFKVIKTFKFFSKINPWVALGVFAIGWLYFSSRRPESPDFGDSDFNNFEKGILLNHQSNDMSIPVVYGTRKIGGTRVFVETSGTDNEFLYIGLVLCEGEIESIEKIYIDDKEVTWSGALTNDTSRTVASSDGNFYKDSTSLIEVKAHTGTEVQGQCSLLGQLDSWTSNHRLRGIAYLSFKFKWNQDAFAGLPNIKALVKGRKVYNANLDGSVTGGSGSHRQGDSSTWEYNDIPVWSLLDYLRNERFGKGLPDDAFDSNWADWQTAADVCTANVVNVSGGSNIALLNCHAVIDTSRKVIDNVRELTKGCRAFLPYVGGKYKIIAETTGSASITLTEDDIIGGYSLSSESKSNKFNRVIVSYVNPDRNYQVDEVQWPEIDDSGYTSADQHATMKTADGGFLLEGRFDFTTITNKYQATELAEIICRRSRDSKGLQLTVGFDAYDLAIGDIVNITLSSLGYSAKPHRVIGITFNEDYTIDLSLVIHQDSHYTWVSKNSATATPSTTLPNPFTVQPPASITLGDQLIEYNDGTVIVALDITIGASPDKFVNYYQVEYKKSTESDYIIYAQGTLLTHRVLNVIDQDTYNVRIKAINSLGVSSTYVTATRTIIGAIANPSDVTGFSCNIVGQEAHLSWKSIPDLDLAYYSIRYSSVTSNAEWSSSVNLVDKVSRPATSVVVPARVGSYLIKAVDKLGNLSLNETIVSSNIAGILNYNSIQTQSEHSAFNGTTFFDSAQGDFDDATGDFDDGFSTNLAVSDNKLRLNSEILFDSATGDFDDNTTKLFDSTPNDNSLPSSGYYYFGTPIDVGAIATVRLTASIKQTSDNVDAVFDTRSGDFDDGSGIFDGDTPQNVRSLLQISVSDDDITYSDYRDFVIGEYKSRYFKFRLLLESLDNSSTPLIEELSITIDIVDRIFSGNNITSGAGSYSLSFTNPFYSSNYALGITAEDMATGDFFEISSKTINGFNILFKNSSGSAVSRKFDYIAKGY